MVVNKRISLMISLLFLGVIACASFVQLPDVGNDKQWVTGKGNIAALKKKYELWKKTYENNQGAEVLTMGLRFSRAFSAVRSDAAGVIKINLVKGDLDLKVTGLDKNLQYALWMVGGLKSDSGKEVQKKIGTFKAHGSSAYFSAHLDRQVLQDFYIDKVLVSRADQPSALPALLTGSPGLFQRIYYSDLIWPVTGVGQLPTTEQQELPFGFLLPKPAFAGVSLQQQLETVLGEQIAMGRDLFINETFDGNGRTCTTCHRLENNHTIDPKFIAGLPDNDPLFVAEFNPDLAELENPKLLRQFALIKVNVDGFDRPGVFRGVPHTLALATSITPEVDKEQGLVLNAVGWSADGAPGDGSLRLFTEGAVIQHLSRTLNREPGVDFRLPTDDELDAMEAYLLSLGRTFDPDIDGMTFSSPLVQRGKELFHSKDIGTGQCKGCHFNGGANSSTSLQNANRDTGVENMPENPARIVWNPTPVDGGFGKEQRHDCGWDNQQTCYGNGEFNIATVIEAADTPPFFHNNSVNTIEEAIAFYNTNAFHASPGAKPADPNDPDSTCGRCIHLESTQVMSVALFVRTLNAMENIRSSNVLDVQVKELTWRNGRQILRLAIEETKDAIEVLEGGQVIANPGAVKKLKAALKFEKRALRYRFTRGRNRLLGKAIMTKDNAKDLLLVHDET